MSFLLVVLSLVSFIAVGSKAFAEGAYEPIDEVTPAYSGPLSWNHYSSPRNNSTIPLPGTFNYSLMALDIDDNDDIYTVGTKNSTGIVTMTGVVEKISDNGRTVTDITYNANLINPRGIAVDKNGNVYVTDNSTLGPGSVGRILKLPHGTNSWVPITGTQTFRIALGVAADDQGNVFVTEYSGTNNPLSPTGNVFMLPSGGSSWVNINGVATSFYVPWDIAADGEGNVFVSDSSPVNGFSVVQKRPPGPPTPLGGNIWTNIAPSAGQANSFFAAGISVDKFDNVYTIGLGGGVNKLRYNGGQNDWTNIAVTSDSLSVSAFDVAADSSGYFYSTNLVYGNVSKLMASVTYNANGGSGTAPIDLVGYEPYESAIVAGNSGSLARSGYLFNGWATASNATVPEYVPGDTITLTQSVTLYAVWSPLLTITYNGNGSTGGSVPTAPGYKSGDTAIVNGNTGNLVKTGHVFEGWKSTSDPLTGITYAPGDTITMTQSITLYANWTPVSTISYNGNGNTGGSVPVDSGAYKQGVTATVYGNTGNLVKPYHIFGGWTTGSGVTEGTYAPGETFTITGNVIFYAKWIQIPKYLVTYQAGIGGSLSGSVTESVYSGSFPVSVPTATPELGNTFLGWSKDGGATLLTSLQLASTDVTEDITYTAYFKPPVTLSSLTLDSAGYTLERGSTHQTVTTAVYSDNSTFTLSSGVTYSSSNANVASVNGTGLVTALNDGQTVITATYGDKQAQAIVTVYSHESSGGGGGSTPSNPGFQIIVDGVIQEQLATAQRTTVNGRNVTTITLDNKKVMDKLEKENNNLITIPVSGDSDVVVGQLNGSLVKSLQSKDALIRIVTDKAIYTLPASQINIDNLSSQAGSGVKLEDITINIQISETPKDKATQVEGAAKQNQYTLVGAPVDFEVTASYGTRTVPANKFNSYVERKIVLPDGTDASDVTTGVVWTEDRKLGHVPTIVVKENGKTYAIINSLTNSTYSVVYNPREMNDVKGHWAQADVNDMSSRLIVNGMTATDFHPDASITRAEFVAIVTRGLGIQENAYADSFKDVTINSWYARTVQAAIDYKLIDGYEDGTFRPDQNITRQEATAVLARAASIAKLKSELPAAEVTRVLSTFKDGSEIASWARTNVAAAISLNLMNGRGEKLEVDANLTRAETAALVRRLLQAAKLINS
ncbi:S-layer homology domain-containing protein [Paenibacillus contaminans]|nr:S-layer homology domain-containing protein [Paenibacillus contaminans]